MPINADKPHLWKDDIQKSVDIFNKWFMNFAPKAYRDTRVETTRQVENMLVITKDFTFLSRQVLQDNPQILSTLRMSTCPPLARDRLIGLAKVSKSLVARMENGSLPTRMCNKELQEHLKRIAAIILKMLDSDIFPWLETGQHPTKKERYRASTIVADRLCGSVAEPIIRNAQERRQLAYIGDFLKKRGYREKAHPTSRLLQQMEPGTYSFRMNVVVGCDNYKVNIPVDCVVQPRQPRESKLPILIEAKSAGDFTNVNKRRKEEATKVHQLKETYGDHVEFILFLCGYFDTGYLGYEAAERIDWIWEHRIDDMVQLGL